MLYGKTPINILNDNRISLNDLRVYIALSSFQGKNPYCFSSLKKISERSGVFVSHISKHTKRLHNFGWITITRRGKKMSNRYIVKSDISESGESLKGDISESGMSDIPESGYSIIKEHLKGKEENSLLTETQKYFSSLSNQSAFKKNKSKVLECS